MHSSLLAYSPGWLLLEMQSPSTAQPLPPTTQVPGAGAGVGSGWGAPPSVTHKRELVSSNFKPELVHPCAWSRSWSWLRLGCTALGDAQEGVGVIELQARELVLVSSSEHLSQDSRWLHAWISIQNDGGSTRDMGACHAGATQRSAASVRGVRSRDDVATRRPNVRATAIVAEGRTRIQAGGGADSNSRWHKCWGESACIAVAVSSSDHHHDAALHGTVDGIRHGLLRTTATQAHACNGRARGILGQIQS